MPKHETTCSMEEDSESAVYGGEAYELTPEKELITVLQTSKRDRAFLVYDNKLPFYCSSGHHSGQAGTWFPCLGTQVYNNPYHLFSSRKTHHRDGWIVKGSRVNKTIGFKRDTKVYEDNVFLASLYDQTINAKGATKGIDSFYRRMGHSKAMAISAYFDGGIWETDFGLALKEQLALHFPHILGRPAPTFDIIKEEDVKDAFPSVTTDIMINEFIWVELQKNTESDTRQTYS